MSDLVEKVARAIARAGGWEVQVHHWNAEARAAIAAVLDHLEPLIWEADGLNTIADLRRELCLSRPEKPQDAPKGASGYPWHKSG